uniref:Uncharacterized protein n=1 Tax=Knipowitschia caucasica TaxID=637954 RepID=A0AAV2JZR4_KNICA
MELRGLWVSSLLLLALQTLVVVPAGSLALGRLERWVRSGLQSLQWNQLNRCLRTSGMSEAECRRLSHLPLSSVAVYVSEPPTAAGSSDKVVAVLPDTSVPLGHKPRGSYSGLNAGSHRHQAFPSSTAHDAVLLLDPSPGENFGHPVVLFYVDLNVTKKRCSHLDGIYLGEECLTLALKGQCQNQLKRRLRAGIISGSSRTVERTIGGLCEVHFLPLVVSELDNNHTQRLTCVDHTEFAPCPRPLPLGPPSVPAPSLPAPSCELNKNTRRCHQQPLATHLSCRLYQTCDHALLLSGGWQRHMTFQHHVQNLQKFYQMLRNNGFHKSNIKTFFANGGPSLEDVEGVYPATEKAAIRNHVSYVCRKQHCADSLVLFLNSPTRSDGTMLLWDANLDGIADLKERYSVNELLADLAGCRATRVLLFVDQSYSGNPSKQSHMYQRESLDWDQDNWVSISPATCLQDHFGKDAGTSHLLEPWAGLLNVTLAGAPCHVIPPLSDGEMRRQYQGCQNLPTALWHQNLRRVN